MPEDDGDLPARSLAKAASYRMGAIVLDLIGAFAITGKIRVALGFTVVINICALAGYYAHERLWSRIAWARRQRAGSARPSPQRARGS
jgi:uncharacterized membrane protein